jgi:hypothetical protein
MLLGLKVVVCVLKGPLSPSGSSPNKLGERDTLKSVLDFTLPQLVGGAVRRTEGEALPLPHHQHARVDQCMKVEGDKRLVDG